MGHLVDEAKEEIKILKAKIERFEHDLNAARERLARAEDRLITAPAREAEEDRMMAELLRRAQEEIKTLTVDEIFLVLEECKKMLKQGGMTDLEVNAFMRSSWDAAKGGKQ